MNLHLHLPKDTELSVMTASFLAVSCQVKEKDEAQEAKSTDFLIFPGGHAA